MPDDDQEEVTQPDDKYSYITKHLTIHVTVGLVKIYGRNETPETGKNMLEPIDVIACKGLPKIAVNKDKLSNKVILEGLVYRFETVQKFNKYLVNWQKKKLGLVKTPLDVELETAVNELNEKKRAIEEAETTLGEMKAEYEAAQKRHKAIAAKVKKMPGRA